MLENVNDYLRVRMEQYLERRKHGMKQEQEQEFYSNIMEIVSLMNYCYIDVSLTNIATLQAIRGKRVYSGYKGF